MKEERDFVTNTSIAQSPFLICTTNKITSTPLVQGVCVCMCWGRRGYNLCKTVLQTYILYIFQIFWLLSLESFSVSYANLCTTTFCDQDCNHKFCPASPDTTVQSYSQFLHQIQGSCSLWQGESYCQENLTAGLRTSH